MLKSKFLTAVPLFLLLAFGSHVQAETEVEAQAQVGDIAPGFTIKRLDGTEFNLADYRGQKQVHLMFWATWCPVCRAEIPAIKKLHAEHGDTVEVLAVSVNGSIRPIPKYVEQHQLTYPVAFDVSRTVLEQYDVSGTPTQILIDKQGVIVYRGSETPSMNELQLSSAN